MRPLTKSQFLNTTERLFIDARIYRVDLICVNQTCCRIKQGLRTPTAHEKQNHEAIWRRLLANVNSLLHFVSELFHTFFQGEDEEEDDDVVLLAFSLVSFSDDRLFHYNKRNIPTVVVCSERAVNLSHFRITRS